VEEEKEEEELCICYHDRIDEWCTTKRQRWLQSSSGAMCDCGGCHAGELISDRDWGEAVALLEVEAK
jgi:hypothetical protein